MGVNVFNTEILRTLLLHLLDPTDGVAILYGHLSLVKV